MKTNIHIMNKDRLVRIPVKELIQCHLHNLSIIIYLFNSMNPNFVNIYFMSQLNLTSILK